MLKMRGKYREIAVFAVLLTPILACGKKSSKKSVPEPPQRSGTAFVSYSNKFTDESPAFNADGSRLIFISGRGSEEENAVLKAYKLAWAADAAPDESQVTRVTTADLGRETRASISPDGKWVAVAASNSDGNSIYVQGFDESGGERLVLKTTDQTGAMAFSPDSRLLLWLKKSQTDVTVQIVDIGTTSTDAISEPRSLNGVTGAASAAWIPGGTGYSVVVAESGVAAGVATLVNRFDFAAVADAATVSPTKILDAQYYDKRVSLTANASSISFVSVVPGSSRVLVPRFGKTEDPQPTIPMRSQPQWAAASASASVENADPFAYETQQVMLGADNSALFGLSHVYYFCEGDAGATYGTGLVNINLSDKSLARLSPRLNAAGDGFEMASGLCDNLDTDQVRRRVDNRITEFTVNSSATSSTFRLAYVTRISTKFDTACTLKLGDPDIYLVNASGDSKTIYQLKGNQVGLESDALPEGTTPCNL